MRWWPWRRWRWQHPTPESEYLERLRQARRAQESSRRRLATIDQQEQRIEELVEKARKMRESNHFGAMWTELFRSARR